MPHSRGYRIGDCRDIGMRGIKTVNQQANSLCGKAAMALCLTRRIERQPAPTPHKPVEHPPNADFTVDEQRV